MNTTTHANADQVLRRYLLGQLDPGTLEEVEGRLFSDDRVFWERLCLAEDELADDYAWGKLEGEDRIAFERHFLVSDERRAKVEFARALRGCLEGRQARTNPIWQWLRVPVTAPGWAVAVAAVLLLAVVPGVAWRIASLRAPQDVVGAWLTPGQVRDIGQQMPRVDIGAGCQMVRLPLEIGAGRFASYSATLFETTDRETEVWPARQLSSETVDGKLAVVLTLPCDLLRDADYAVRLQGVSPGRDPETLGRYSFRVRRQ
jgi:hypothetical protein